VQNPQIRRNQDYRSDWLLHGLKMTAAQEP
jgi:hypothetical protein